MTVSFATAIERCIPRSVVNLVRIIRKHARKCWRLASLERVIESNGNIAGRSAKKQDSLLGAQRQGPFRREGNKAVGLPYMSADHGRSAVSPLTPYLASIMTASHTIISFIEGTTPPPSWSDLYTIDNTEQDLMQALAEATLSFQGRFDGFPLSTEAQLVHEKWAVFAEQTLSGNRLSSMDKMTMCILIEVCSRDMEDLRNQVMGQRLRKTGEIDEKFRSLFIATKQLTLEHPREHVAAEQLGRDGGVRNRAIPAVGHPPPGLHMHSHMYTSLSDAPAFGHPRHQLQAARMTAQQQQQVGFPLRGLVGSPMVPDFARRSFGNSGQMLGAHLREDATPDRAVEGLPVEDVGEGDRRVQRVARPDADMLGGSSARSK